MKKLLTYLIILALLSPAASYAAMTYSASDFIDPEYNPYLTSMDSSLNRLYLFCNEVETALELWGLDGTTYMTLAEISAPSGNPGSGYGWLYVKDNGGTMTLYFEDER